MYVVDVDGLAVTFRGKTMVLVGTLPNSTETFEVRISPAMLDEMNSAYTAMRMTTKPKTKKEAD